MSRGNAGAAQSAGAVSERSEVDYRLLFEQSSSQCLVLCPDAPRFTIVEASDAYLAATRTERAAILGQGVLEAFAASQSPTPTSDGLDLCASFERVQASKAIDTLESRRPEGETDDLAATAKAERLTLLVNSPVLDANGELRYIVHSRHDLGRADHHAEPDWRALELARLLKQKSAELDRSRTELDAFNYSIAHDLRAPLRAIDGFSQALSCDHAAALDSQAKHYLDRVRAGALRMTLLIDSLLELSRVQRAPLSRSSVDLGALARTIFDDLKEQQPERAVRVKIGQDLFANADVSLMRLALEQLCKNAWKFTAKKADAEIRFGRATSTACAPFCLTDDGAGFEMARASRLFSPFQRLHKASEFEGTGMGLALVQCVLSRHGGRIWAEAQPGAGANFFFTLEADHV